MTEIRYETGSGHDAGTRHQQFRSAIEKLIASLLERGQAAHDTGNPEAIHDLRVASRRLRAAVEVLRPLFPRSRTAKLTKRLKRLTSGLGRAREWDVTSQMLGTLHQSAGSTAARAAIEHLLEKVATERTGARRKMVRELRRLEPRHLASKLRRLLDRFEERGVVHDLGRFAWEALEPLTLDAFSGLPSLRDRDRADELHMVRIRTKKLRYVLELMKAAFNDGHADLLALVKEFQEVLGRHHDAVVLEQVLQRELSLLEEEGREVLAHGVRETLARIRGERHTEFEAFRAYAERLDAGSFATQVRRGLGLDGD